MPDRLLRDIPLFTALTPAERTLLASITKRREVVEGEHIFKRSDLRSALIMVVRGRIRIYHVFQGQVETLALLGPASFIGEQALINPTQLHQHSAVADIGSELLVIRGSDFLRLRRKQPHLAVKVLSGLVGMLADRLSHADTKLLTLYTTGKIAASAGTIQGLASSILRIVLPTVKARKGLFVLYRPEEQVAVIREAIGYRTNLPGARIPLGRDPILGRQLRNGEELLVTRSEYHHDAHWKTRYSGPGMLVEPIKAGTQTLGSLLFADKRDGEDFSVNNRLLTSVVARQVAAAVEDAALQEERQLREELKRVYIKPL